MFTACHDGHLHVAKWLFEVGSAEDIRTKNNDGRTPMFAACWNGHLGVAKWLFEVGTTEDIRTKNNDGRTPMFVCKEGHLDVVKWLFEVATSISSSGWFFKAPPTTKLVTSAAVTWGVVWCWHTAFGCAGPSKP